jgi:nucleoside 2-deoxyribosyltransferase
MMEKSDVIIANLTPFAGASADAGKLIEVGWFLGKGKVPHAGPMAKQSMKYDDNPFGMRLSPMS